MQKLDVDESIILLHELENQLTHPQSKSSVYRWLKSHYHEESNYDTPVFKGTRVPVSTFFEYLEAGHSLNEFLEDFPTVTKQQAIQVLERFKDQLLQPQ